VTSPIAAALLEWYARRAREQGIEHGRSGAIAFVLRFGSALNLNLHLHTHALDGVFTKHAGGALRFHPLPPPLLFASSGSDGHGAGDFAVRLIAALAKSF
jgi:hypothetical protein